jgi:serine/threonine-protein kinase HipA
MNRSANVFLNGIKAGELVEEDHHFVFQYDVQYLALDDAKAVSLTLPLQKAPFASTTLFPFFAGLIAEGINKDIQCRLLKVDENDLFGLLLKTADKDTIGAVTVKPKSVRR